MTTADQSAPIRVAIADDHPLFREALQDAVAVDARLALVGTVQTGAEALEMIYRLEPDVVLLDSHMQGMDGREIVRAIRRSHLETRVLVISEHHAGELVLQVLTAGATGFLSKRATSAEVIAAILQVAAGQAVLPSDIGTDLAATLRERGPSGTHLTERERMVIDLMAEGLSSIEIAERLHLAVTTIRTHVQNVYFKLGVNNRAAAVAEAMRRGLLG